MEDVLFIARLILDFSDRCRYMRVTKSDADISDDIIYMHINKHTCFAL